MPRETIRRLATDLERVLIAGAHLAPSDPALRADRQAIDRLAAQLGAKAPAIGRLATACAAALDAKGEAAVRDTVALSTMTAQVRAAQAQPAPVGDTTPLPARPPLGTPCNAKELGDLYRALVESGGGRMEVIQQGIERGDIADLRLVDAVIHAMGTPWVGDQLAQHAVPRLGPAVIAPLRAVLRIADGQAIDARRLRALLAVDAAGSRDLVERALAEGNVEMRAAALNAIADHFRGDAAFTATVHALLRQDRSGDVRRAALRALAGYADAASFAALVAGLDDARTREAAIEALGHVSSASARDAMLERLATAVASHATLVTSKTKKPEQAALDDVVALVRLLLRALAQQRDPRIAAAALPLVATFGADAAQAALPSADAAQLATLADLLVGHDADLFPCAAAAAVALGPAQAFTRLSAAFDTKDKDALRHRARLAAIIRHLGEQPDPRWADICQRHLDGPAAPWAIAILATLGATAALAPIAAIAAGGVLPAKGKPKSNSTTTAAAIRALGRLGGIAQLPAILAHHRNTNYEVIHAVIDTVVALDDPTTVDAVRTLVAALGDAHGHWQFRSLLRHLERRFPGK